MSVKYTATWTCDGCKTKKVVANNAHWAPDPWVLVAKYTNAPNKLSVGGLKESHYCAKCAKEKGL